MNRVLRGMQADGKLTLGHNYECIIINHITQDKAIIRNETAVMNIDNNAAQALNHTWDHTVTFTLTPDNADSIPRNVVHLIVAEGVTEIPDNLCDSRFKRFRSLETVVFAKSVAVIGSHAFHWCTKLKSVVFANDSQLREIGIYVFRGCKSLQSIAIPDSVTTIGEDAFDDCTNLESVLFSDQSCLQEIGHCAFYRCHSLHSIIIPKSVTTIGRDAFHDCSKLKSVIFAEHSSIQVINCFTFCRCFSLQFINIPTTVTAIHRSAFAWCPVLQVIDIPRQAAVRPRAFDTCPLLSTTLEEHSTDCIKGRFDALPIHQSCYKLNDATTTNAIINYIHSIQDNDPTLLQVDIMGMTPLHILCANPAVTKDMMEQLYRKNTAAAAVRNVNDMLPWHMYVVNKDKQFCMFIEDGYDDDDDDDDDGGPIIRMTDTAWMILSNEFDPDKLVEANLDIDTKEMFLILTGSSLFEWLETTNGVTGLYPFMCMATKSNDCNLEDVYNVAMINLNSILQRALPPRNAERIGSQLTADRNAKRMKCV